MFLVQKYSKSTNFNRDVFYYCTAIYPIILKYVYHFTDVKKTEAR